jgi:arabinogalactan oligomer/maltooligosaccharide transport system permease protein
MRTGKGLRLFVTYIILILFAVACIYPALWIVLSSFRPGSSLYSETLFPAAYTLDHYKKLFTSSSIMFPIWYMNTLKIAVFSMVGGTLMTVLTTYALSRFRFKGRQTLLSLILVLGMFSGFMTLVALYVLLLTLELLDTHTAIILVYISGAVVLSFFVAKGFLDTIPKSLEESARIDGASHFTIFWKIMMPLSKPMLTYVALTTFTGAWVDFIFARMVLRSQDKWTVAVGLWDMVNSRQNSDFTAFAAASVLIAVPITLLFMYMQRYFVEGLTAGANKG